MIKIILLSVALAIASAVPAAAHITCWPKYVLMTYLKQKYEEAPIMTGIGSSDWPIEVWRSKDGDTFSIVTYRPPGQACLIASGVEIIEIEWLEPLGEPA
jgi:hypothetical protein